nr:ABC transporter permease [Kibdelosporangium sp. MJ126-NF4]
MTTLLSAEARRLLTTRLWLWGLLSALATGGLVFLTAMIGLENATPPMPGLDTAQGTQLLLGMVSLLAFVPALLGTTAVTAEYRHQTITFTYLFAPRRGALLAAKIGVYAAAGLAYGLVVAVTAGAGLAVAAATQGVSVGLPTGELVGLLCRLTVMMAVYTLLGVAFGALLRNQVAALAVLGGYFYMGETLLLLIPGVNTIYPFLPGGASAGLTGFTFLTNAVAQTGISAPNLLSAPFGALVLLGYVAIAAVFAFTTSLRRDVT